MLATALTVWTADLIALALKASIARPRPFLTVAEADPLIARTLGSSFPSGHAATSFAAAVILGSFFPRLAGPLLALAALVAFSRVYVGVHYPLDVLAGAALGALVGLAAAAVIRARLRNAAGPRRSGAPPLPG